MYPFVGPVSIWDVKEEDETQTSFGRVEIWVDRWWMGKTIKEQNKYSKVIA